MNGGHMSKEAFREYLLNRLSSLDGRIQEMERRLAQGEPREKVEAAGELVILKERQAGVAAKFAKLQNEPEGTWENLRTEIEEDFDSLAVAVERLFVRF
jgi:hypothetical protein